MQLVQIGQTSFQTLQQLIDAMAAHQSAEIEQLKQTAIEKHTAGQIRRGFSRRLNVKRTVCKRPYVSGLTNAVAH